MMQKQLGWVLGNVLVVAGLAVGSPAFGSTIDFEIFPDSTPLTAQIAGLTFTNATVISAGISLNEFEFPPHSGTNVVFDDGGPLVVVLSPPVAKVNGFVTYMVPVTLTAFDAFNNVVGTVTSAFSSNLALSGDPGSIPNEFLEVTFAGGIARVEITGEPLGSSVTLDDFTFLQPVVVTPIPALSSFGQALIVVVIGVSGLLFLRRQPSLGG